MNIGGDLQDSLYFVYENVESAKQDDSRRSKKKGDCRVEVLQSPKFCSLQDVLTYILVSIRCWKQPNVASCFPSYTWVYTRVHSDGTRLVTSR